MISFHGIIKIIQKKDISHARSLRSPDGVRQGSNTYAHFLGGVVQPCKDNYTVDYRE
jgi:hypothetical protein